MFLLFIKFTGKKILIQRKCKSREALHMLKYMHRTTVRNSRILGEVVLNSTEPRKREWRKINYDLKGRHCIATG